jgi:hypothetical protein
MLIFGASNSAPLTKAPGTQKLILIKFKSLMDSFIAVFNPCKSPGSNIIPREKAMKIFTGTLLPFTLTKKPWNVPDIAGAPSMHRLIRIS